MWRPITQIGDVIGVPDYSSPLDSEDESIGFRLARLALRVLLLRREPGRDPIVVRMAIEPVQQQHAALGRVLRLAPLRGFVALFSGEGARVCGLVGRRRREWNSSFVLGPKHAILT